MIPSRAIALAAALAALPADALAARLAGTVLDRGGRPVELAAVAVPERRTGTACDADGRFTLELPEGPVTLEVTQLGYRPARLSLVLGPEGAEVVVRLESEPVPLAEVAVTASTFGSRDGESGAVVRRLDIYTTPGGAADVFQALRGLPGINAPNEGAALFVRGGDPRETIVRVDGGDIGHPYHYEGASGGLFSTLDTYMLKSALFSSGGFGARYGGALSGVLDIETQDPLDLRTVTTGVNLAGAGASTSWALVPGRLSFVGASRYSDVRVLDRLYESSSRYVSVPRSADGVARLIGRYSPTGRLTLTHLASGDAVGVVANRLNVEGDYRQRSRNAFTAVQASDVVLGRVAVRGQAALQAYRTRWSYGPASLERRERTLQANLDAVWPANDRHELTFGFNWRRPDTRITGTMPADSTDWRIGAPTRTLATDATPHVLGVHVEDKVRLAGALFATLGARFDRSTTPAAWTTDPRAALALRVDERQTIRIAAGRYHQRPDAEFLDPRYGNPDLAPLRADHLIAGWEWTSETGTLRLEAYRKDYRNLVTHDAARWYASAGAGRTRGVDAFAQGRVRWLTGWISYGWLDARRRELDDPVEVRSRYGVRHTLTVVANYQLASSWQVGVRSAHSTGRPYTPVVGRTYDGAADLWRPVFGAHQSAEMPPYRRVDVRLTKLFSMPAMGALPESGACVFYVEVLNALDDRNVLDYVYDRDYSERHVNESYFSRRMAVVGFALTW